MKIMQVISQLGNGGAEKLVVELCNEMSKHHEVILVSFRDVEDWMIFPKLLSKKVRLIILHKKSGISLGIFFKLNNLLFKEKPDIVHYHLDAVIKYLVPIIPFYPNIKFINTIHNKLHRGKLKKYRILYTFRCFTRRIKYICISNSIQGSFVKVFPMFNFTLIENGINEMHETPLVEKVEKEIKNYRKKGFSKILLAVGRIDFQKNYSMMLETFINKKYNNVLCLIIGDDTKKNKPYLNELLIKKPNNVIFLGSKVNVVDYMRKTDALIMSSLFEGLPIVAIEALSVGMPIICTPAGGLVDLVKQGENGYIANGFNKENFELQIDNYLIALPNEIDLIRKNNFRKFYEKYSIERCAKRYIELYNK